MSAAEAAAASDFGRVRALPAARALVELMAPREANRTGPTAVAAVAGGSSAAMTAFQLRNADMHSFEADRQAWRGTNREYADAGGADLAHKLASVVDGVFRVLRAAAERHPRRDGVTSGVAAAVAAADAARVKARRRDAYARLHALKHAFPGPLADLCTCAWTPCECASTPRRDADAACCDAFAAHRELRRVDNLAGRIREATAAAASADAIANEEITAARAPLARLRWLLAVELITSGAAFELFPGFFGGSGDAGDPGREPAAGPDDVAAARRGENLRARLSPRFLRRAFSPPFSPRAWTPPSARWTPRAPPRKTETSPPENRPGQSTARRSVCRRRIATRCRVVARRRRSLGTNRREGADPRVALY